MHCTYFTPWSHAMVSRHAAQAAPPLPSCALCISAQHRHHATCTTHAAPAPAHAAPHQPRERQMLHVLVSVLCYSISWFAQGFTHGTHPSIRALRDCRADSILHGRHSRLAFARVFIQWAICGNFAIHHEKHHTLRIRAVVHSSYHPCLRKLTCVPRMALHVQMHRCWPGWQVQATIA